ncbi:MAG: hypothetical protein BWK77_08840 [Verrucomicrobia bacterium A1]|nr:MAG: hypothetical protein BWK77_08840 [Verrucomicrobia bacterium A1]
MKNLMIAVLAVLLSAAAAGAGEYGTASSELSVAPQLFLPGSAKCDLYSMGYGAEIQYRYWFFDPFGVAFSIGAANYEIDGNSDYFEPIRVDDGSMTLLPVGPSALYRIAEGEVWTITLEGGIRYVLVNSDLKLATGQSVSVDDSVVGVLALKCDWQLTEILSVFSGIGYHSDIKKGEVDNGRMKHNELQSLLVDLGVRFRF